MSCPCGLSAETEACCGRYIHGGQSAPTAEALMRSRYTAYVLEEIDHVVASTDPKTRGQVDPAGALQWSQSAEWEGLDVHEASGSADDDEGVVEFTARYLLNGSLIRHRERATFKRINKHWFYHDGDMIKAKPVVREGRKVGRNDPCPCDSGKKHKKCCGR